MIRRATLVLAFMAVALGATTAFAATTVTVDQTKITNGYMNVFDLGDVYQWGSGWGFGDLCASYNSGDLKLSPNCIGDPNPYWYVGGGATGNPGNKKMGADSYAQVDNGSLAGEMLTFVGWVTDNSLTQAHAAKAFIRDFAPDFSSMNQQSIALPTYGPFSVSLALANDGARHVQWGFDMYGPCVWYTDLAPFGSVTIAPFTPVPAKTESWGKLKALYR